MQYTYRNTIAFRSRVTFSLSLTEHPSDDTKRNILQPTTYSNTSANIQSRSTPNSKILTSYQCHPTIEKKVRTKNKNSKGMQIHQTESASK